MGGLFKRWNGVRLTEDFLVYQSLSVIFWSRLASWGICWEAKQDVVCFHGHAQPVLGWGNWQDSNTQIPMQGNFAGTNRSVCRRRKPVQTSTVLALFSNGRKTEFSLCKGLLFRLLSGRANKIRLHAGVRKRGVWHWELEAVTLSHTKAAWFLKPVGETAGRNVTLN